MPKTSNPSKNQIPAVGRTLAVLELLAHSRKALNISEVSRALKLPKSSIFRMLTALEYERCVQKDARSGRYRFGFRLVSLSRAAVENLQIREVARPLLVSLMLTTGMAVHLAVLEHGQAIIIEKIEAPGVGRVGTWPGRAMDINSTAVGKALVAFLSPEEFDQQVKTAALVKHNQKTISSMAKLKEHLARVRELGYAVDDEEDEVGSRCIGAPILNRAGKLIAAISIVGTVDLIPREEIRRLGAIVKRCAASISASLEG
jgi:DNA-binding IclR family transcriptional regulator